MKVEELVGAQLDYWVAKAAGVDAVMSDPHRNGSRNMVTFYGRDHNGKLGGRSYMPSAQWSDGGKIIERENIQISPPTSPVHRYGGPNAGNGQSGSWSACTWHRGVDGHRAIGHDEKSPLVAAMRCFVRSKFGETVSDEAAAPHAHADLLAAAQYEDAYGDGHLDGPQ